MDKLGPGSAPRAAVVLAFAAAFLAVAYYFRYRAAEDFVYYYCSGAVSLAGKNPYATGDFQGCIASWVGGPSPYAGSGLASAYPPNALLVFRSLASLPPPLAYGLWNLALLAASLAALCLLGGAAIPWNGVLFLAWPGLMLGWGFHKISIPLFCCFLFAIRELRARRPVSGGLLCGVLSLQPQWFFCAALFLACQRRWRALAAALVLGGALCAAFSRPEAGALEWLASARAHAALWSPDSQNLFLAARRLRPFAFGGSLLLYAAAALLCRKRDLECYPLFLALALLAQPYSHASDSIWIFPFFLATLGSIGRLLDWPYARAAAIAVGVELTAAWCWRFYAPESLATPAFLEAQRFIALAAAGTAAAAWLLSRRAPSPSRNFP